MDRRPLKSNGHKRNPKLETEPLSAKTPFKITALFTIPHFLILLLLLLCLFLKVSIPSSLLHQLLLVCFFNSFCELWFLFFLFKLFRSGSLWNPIPYLNLFNPDNLVLFDFVLGYPFFQLLLCYSYGNWNACDFRPCFFNSLLVTLALLFS